MLKLAEDDSICKEGPGSGIAEGGEAEGLDISSSYARELNWKSGSTGSTPTVATAVAPRQFHGRSISHLSLAGNSSSRTPVDIKMPYIW